MKKGTISLDDDGGRKGEGKRKRSNLTRNFEEKRNLASCLLFKEMTPDDHNNKMRGNYGTLVIE